MNTNETTVDLDNLERLARAATPGPWRECSDLPCYAIAAGDYRVVQTTNQNNYRHSGASGRWLGIENERNAAYIAAANPTTMLTLIARLREAERERDRYRDMLGACVPISDDGKRVFIDGIGDRPIDFDDGAKLEAAEAALAEAVGVIRDVANPIGHLRRYATSQGGQLNGVMAHRMANDPNFIKGIAAAFIAKHGGSDD